MIRKTRVFGLAMAKTLDSVSLVFASYWAPIVAFGALGASTWVAFRYAGQRIVEVEHFRQTETALTAYWMIKEPWRLAYQTPGWGYPWSAPIEFPIYQGIVALIVRFTDLALEPVGRLVSFAFLVGLARPAFMVQKRLNLPSETAWLFCALVWSSPLYLLWGRSFMISVPALFFTLAAIPYLLDLRQPNPPYSSIILSGYWGTLGMLQRTVTAGPTLLVCAVILLLPTLRGWQPRVFLRRLAYAAIAVGLPLAIGVLWTAYADVIKSYNFVGRELTLRFRLSDQYVGTLAQRFDLSALKELFWTRMFQENAAGFLGLALVTGALIFAERSLKFLLLICLVLAAFPVMLFFDVSLFLEHYQVSSTVFLIAAVAISCVAWLPTVVRWPGLVPLVASLLVLSNVSTFWTKYGSVVRAKPDVTNSRGLAIGDVIRRYTPEDSGIVVFNIHSGIDSWCLEIPYLSQRKGFTVPNYKEHLVEDPASYLGGKELGAMVFCSPKDSARKDRYNNLIKRYSQTSGAHLFRVKNCYVWLPNASTVVLADGTSITPTQLLN